MHEGSTDPICICQRTPRVRGKCCVTRLGSEPGNSGRLVEALEQADATGFVAFSQGPDRHRLLATSAQAVLRDWSVWLLKVLKAA
jgi:hypothetical protein